MALLESSQFKHRRRGDDMNDMLLLVFYSSSSLHSYHAQRLKTGAKWPPLGVHAWSDNIGGWILSHLTLARLNLSRPTF